MYCVYRYLPFENPVQYLAQVTHMLQHQKDALPGTPAVPVGLISWYSMMSFTDMPSGLKYWVAVEKQADANGRNLKVWLSPWTRLCTEP
jgi:hypothetical protein